MSAPEQDRHTPLYQIHLDLGARMTDFAGFRMPIQYTGVIEEHRAVRTSAGIFDVSHMGEVMVRGPRALDYVQRLVTNDAAALVDGKAMYTVMCREDGGIVDDLLVYRYAADEFMLVINAANIEKDLSWMQKHRVEDMHIEDVSADVALIAIQGPDSHQIVQKTADQDISGLTYYHFIRPAAFLGKEGVTLSYTGYTGERGLEIYCRPDDAPAIWTSLMGQRHYGLLPCGLAARDTLRTEAGFALYGNDITDETNPLEAGLGWLVKFDKGDFVGRDSLKRIREEKPSRRMIGFVLEERGIPRPGSTITDRSGAPIGTVTSGTQSPILERGIGMGYVPNEAQFTTEGNDLYLSIRGRSLRMRVVRPPFHKK